MLQATDIGPRHKSQPNEQSNNHSSEMKSGLINTDAQTHARTHTHISLCISFSCSNTSAWIHTHTEAHRMRTIEGSGLVCHFGVPLNNDRLIIRGEHTHTGSVWVSHVSAPTQWAVTHRCKTKQPQAHCLTSYSSDSLHRFYHGFLLMHLLLKMYKRSFFFIYLFES